MWRKKKMFKKITSICAAAVLSLAASVTAYADESDYYTREQIIDEYWTQYWDNSLPGEENPEGSLEYHILEEWLDDVYGKSEYECDIDWSSSYSIGSAWKDYYQEKTECWHYVDDKDTGEFYIESYDPDTDTYGDDKLYTFTLADGKWNMVDSNGNVVESFDPHGGDGSWYAIQNEDKSSHIDELLKHMSDNSEETESASGNSDTDTYEGDYENEPAQTAQTTEGETAAAPPITVKDEESSEEESADSSSESYDSSADDSSSPLPYIAGGIVLIGAGGAAGYFVNKKRDRK
jgi:hypothetical protein